MFILCSGLETAIERYTVRILRVTQIIYICLDAVDINGGYSSSSGNLHVNRDAWQITWERPTLVSPSITSFDTYNWKLCNNAVKPCPQLPQVQEQIRTSKCRSVEVDACQSCEWVVSKQNQSTNPDGNML